MALMDRLASELGGIITANRNRIAEIRLRCGRPLRLRMIDGTETSGKATDALLVQRIACMLMENSVYAREEELKQGYFTAEGGCRVGVCGKVTMLDGKVVSLSAIGSVCIRIPREIRGCADPLKPFFPCNMLILSPPGLGKTTMLRDLARQLSDSGMNVAVTDERREICACLDGIPQLDAGCRTDVMDGCPKAMAIPMLIRSCSPDVIIADEIGGEMDCEALRDASRCGVGIVATAHASTIEEAMARNHIGKLLAEGVFTCTVLLGSRPGQILEVRKMICGVEGKC